MRLAPAMGRQQAHDVVYAACRIVNEEGGTLVEALARDPQVSALAVAPGNAGTATVAEQHDVLADHGKLCAQAGQTDVGQRMAVEIGRAHV